MRCFVVCVTVLVVTSAFDYAQEQDSMARACAVVTCGVGHHGETRRVRSTTGFIIALKVQGDDDHSKNSHLCMADYVLQINASDGSSKTYQILDSDDQWGRPLTFRIEGFSNDSSFAHILLLEGNYPQSLQAIEFDMRAGKSVNSVLLGPAFTGQLSRECAATLHIAGTLPTGYIVLGTEEKEGCARAEHWQLSQNKNLAWIAADEVANNHPARLSPHATFAQLEAGRPVEP